MDRRKAILFIRMEWFDISKILSEKIGELSGIFQQR